MNADTFQSSASPAGDELLDRATAELRDASIAPGPTSALVAVTQARLRAMDYAAAPSGSWTVARTMARLAAAIALLGGGAIAYRAATMHRHYAPIAHVPSPVSPPMRFASSATNPTQPLARVPTQVAVSPTPAASHEGARVDNVIRGRVWFEGAPPTPAVLTGAQLAMCEHLHAGPIRDESLIVGPGGTLANVVVSVSGGLSGWLREEFPPPSEPAVLDQKGCAFVPHVVAVMVGQPLLIKNSDPFLHNVHVLAVNNPEANLGQPTLSELSTQPFESPEVFRVRCDVHPWMSAWVRVVDNPFFCVTGADGTFSLAGLPPGTYSLKAWQEQLGVREMQVTVEAGGNAWSDIVFNAAPAR